jgi:hypothetical protein
MIPDAGLPLETSFGKLAEAFSTPEKSLGLIGNASGRKASADRGLNPRRFR